MTKSNPRQSEEITEVDTNPGNLILVTKVDEEDRQYVSFDCHLVGRGFESCMFVVKTDPKNILN